MCFTREILIRFIARWIKMYLYKLFNSVFVNTYPGYIRSIYVRVNVVLSHRSWQWGIKSAPILFYTFGNDEQIMLTVTFEKYVKKLNYISKFKIFFLWLSCYVYVILETQAKRQQCLLSKEEQLILYSSKP